MSDFNALLDTMDELTDGLTQSDYAAAPTTAQVATLTEIAAKVPDLVAAARAREETITALKAALDKVDKDAYYGTVGLIPTTRVRQIIEENLGEQP
jgi:hypothetical protein